MEPMRDFAQLQLHFVDQIQWRYELIRPLVLFAEGTATQRAQDTHTHPDTVRTFTRRFHGYEQMPHEAAQRVIDESEKSEELAEV